MDSRTFMVYGIPAPKGSVTRMPNGSYLPAGTAASRMKYDLWKHNIAVAARKAMDGKAPWAGPIRLMAEFRLPVPQSMPGHQLGWLPHIKRPDWDKLTRALADPMKGIVWDDDSQVCFSTMNKAYAWDGHPGCLVIVDFLTYEWCKEYEAMHQTIRTAIQKLDKVAEWDESVMSDEWGEP